MFVFHFHACSPLNSLDRLLCFWQQHGNFFRPLTLKMWGSSLQPPAQCSCFYTQAEAADTVRLAQPGWREGWSRLSADVFLGAHSLFNKRMWSINLPSPPHCIICEVIKEVMLMQLPVQWGALSLYSLHRRLMLHDPSATNTPQTCLKTKPQNSHFHSCIYGNKENNSNWFDLILFMKKKIFFCLFLNKIAQNVL